jgi:hypothetical protein
MEKIVTASPLFSSENIAIVALSVMVALLAGLLVLERRDRKEITQGLIKMTQVISDMETAVKLLGAKI